MSSLPFVCVLVLASLVTASSSANDFLAPHNATGDTHHVQLPDGDVHELQKTSWVPDRKLSPTCDNKLAVILDEKCGVAVAKAFSGVLELLGSFATGGSQAISSKKVAITSIKAIGAVLSVVLPFPAVILISSVVFPILSGIIGGLGTASSSDNTRGDAAVQKLFRHRFRSNKARFMALQGEWSWHKDLFSKDFIAQHGANYEAASLSWLLNVQHDMTLDKELFFNTDCLDVTEKSSFGITPVGRCEDVGMWPISDAPLCEVAAHHVKNYSMDAHSTVVQFKEQIYTKGCFWSSLSGAPKVNSHPDAKEVAQAGHHLLCTTMEPETQKSCATWQESSSWQVSKWYVALHLGVLVDIFNNYPPLRNTTQSRIADTTAEYVLLLTHSFKASVYKRLGYLSAPVVSRLACAGFWWAGTTYMVKDGADYWLQRLGSDSGDERCTGECDVLSLRCDVDPGQNSGWLSDRNCVNASRAEDAKSCFQSYKSAVLAEMSTSFVKDIQGLQEFRYNVTRAVQGRK